MKVARKYIPLSVRVQVAERQLCELGDWGKINVALAETSCRSLKLRLEGALAHLFPGQHTELHHRPALVNRRWNKRTKDYEPRANDPDFLVYLAEDDHDIETRVRGQGAQRSDLGQRRYLKRVAKNRASAPPRARNRHLKVKIRSANRWPPKGSRRISARKP